MNVHQISLSDQYKFQNKQRSRLQIQRWYAGFSYSGKPHQLVAGISKKVQEFQLGKFVPLVRLEKKAKGRFYFFIAIESEQPGKFPTIITEKLLPLPYFKSPALKGKHYFTYEEIKKMVGSAHDVTDYTNPIPYSVANLESTESPFDFCDFIDFSDQIFYCPADNNYIRLLDWLSAKGDGTWNIFQQLCQMLKIEQPNKILRNLKLLGHLETSSNGKKWSIAPTAILPLNNHNLEFYLCGQQNYKLRQELSQFATIKEYPQSSDYAPPCFRISFNELKAYQALETLSGVKIYKPGNIAEQLADYLPSIKQWQYLLIAVGGIVPSQKFWKYYKCNQFRDCSLPECTGLYEMRNNLEQQYPDKVVFYDAETATWRQGDWYGLRFLALYHETQSEYKLQLCHYNLQQGQLAVLASQRWPQIYEKALVLASGQLPNHHKNQDQDWLVYQNISPELAYFLTKKLSLTCGGLE